MKFTVSLLVAPILVFTTACSSHYSVSNHGHGHHRNHVSVGVHGSSHGNAGGVIGALIVGGVIGHLLTEEANHENATSKSNKSVINKQLTAEDELVNGYTLEQKISPKLEKNEEQNRFYKLGKDGKCYLMENANNGEVDIVSMVPEYSCQ
jgi:hypothetical protein